MSRAFNVEICELVQETPDILCIMLTNSNGGSLPKFTAGSHIDVYLDNGLIRQYSLSNSPTQRNFYEIAVLKEVNGKGGSEYIHQTFSKGSVLKISEPRNNFPLIKFAKNHLLLAGGIGVTPMMAMIAELESVGANFLLHYCARSPEKTAFYSRLKSLEKDGKVIFHHDEGNPKNGLDLETLLSSPQQDTHLYYCGPPTFMKAVEKASEKWAAETIHSEYFVAPDRKDKAEVVNNKFQVKIASSGQVFNVLEGQTIVEVLRKNGLTVDTSCEDGYCGTCMTRFLEGEPEHNDHVLDAEDREEFVLICCARSKTAQLVLDL